MTVHRIKADQPHYEHVLEGSKPYEVRLDDRGYTQGDTLQLVEHNPVTGRLTGRAHEVIVTHVLRRVERYWPLQDIDRHGLAVMTVRPPHAVPLSDRSVELAAGLIPEERIARAVSILSERFSLAYTEPPFTPEDRAHYLRQVARAILSL